MWIAIVLLDGIICGIITTVINANKGYEGGFAWGFFLGIIGIIVVACRSDNYSDSYKYEESPLLLSATREKHERAVMADGGWRCYKCGTVNPAYTGTCGCGVTKIESNTRQNRSNEELRKKETDEKEIRNLQKLKGYKELLDSGAITQEEFDKKKIEILK